MIEMTNAMKDFPEFFDEIVGLSLEQLLERVFENSDNGVIFVDEHPN